MLTWLISVIVGDVGIEQCRNAYCPLRSFASKWHPRAPALRRDAHIRNSLSDLRNGESAHWFAYMLRSYQSGACGRSPSASNTAWRIAARTFADAWQRYPLGTNRSSTSRLISNRIRVSLPVCANSVPARCCASGISFSATAVADCRRPRSGASCHFLLALPLAHVTISRRMKIKKLPNILALHLKRFKYQEDLKKYIKLTYRVAFPFELRLFNTVDDVDDPDRLYELFGIVVHIGRYGVPCVCDVPRYVC